MPTDRNIKTLRFQLSKSDKDVGPGLKEAIREAIPALEEKRDRQQGSQK